MKMKMLPSTEEVNMTSLLRHFSVLVITSPHVFSSCLSFSFYYPIYMTSNYCTFVMAKIYNTGHYSSFVFLCFLTIHIGQHLPSSCLSFSFHYPILQITVPFHSPLFFLCLSLLLYYNFHICPVPSANPYMTSNYSIYSQTAS